MPTIWRLSAMEILDSRGKPTVKATCTLKGGSAGSASVPSGASTGTAEAKELRDGDDARYRGEGCRKAVANVNGPIAEALRDCSIYDQGELDRLLLGLDKTPDKSSLGANAILAVSLAFARACAAERGEPLYRQFAEMIDGSLRAMPRLTINLFSGGKHAGAQMPIQDVLIVPAAGTIDEGLAAAYAVYQEAAELALRKYGMRLLTADEGGLAPAFPSIEAAFDDTLEAIQAAGLTPGKDVFLAIDVAASHFFRKGLYELGDEAIDARTMVTRVAAWVERYPIVSVEDGLAEEDWAGWPALRERIGGKALVLGDDLLCTNPQRIKRAIDAKAADALLLKVNQVGTLTEAAEALKMARGAGWRVTISARSGETEDHWLADLAVGWSGDQIKVGSITQSERLAKYNRLLEIEAETKLPVVNWPPPSKGEKAGPVKHIASKIDEHDRRRAERDATRR
jgi:enolase